MAVNIDDAMLSSSPGRRSWRDLPARTRGGLQLAAAVQMALLFAALIDLARRPAHQIRGGRKRVWFPVLFVNFIGPLIYFIVGRVRGDDIDVV